MLALLADPLCSDILCRSRTVLFILFPPYPEGKLATQLKQIIWLSDCSQTVAVSQTEGQGILVY